jgi:hypothetical protein
LCHYKNKKGARQKFTRVLKKGANQKFGGKPEPGNLVVSWNKNNLPGTYS